MKKSEILWIIEGKKIIATPTIPKKIKLSTVITSIFFLASLVEVFAIPTIKKISGAKARRIIIAGVAVAL